MQALVLCLDISESMAYGETAKVGQAVDVIQKAIESLSVRVSAGFITFDTAAETMFDVETSNLADIKDTLKRIVARGVTSMAAGLSAAISLIKENGWRGEILLLTDGRANLSLNRMEGFEGSIALEEEALNIAKEATKKNVVVHSVAVGEDAFTYTLRELSRITGGGNCLADDFGDLAIRAPANQERIEILSLKVHSAPVELPSAQPSWTKESQLTHVAVVSQRIYEIYKTHRRSFLVNPASGREARTALMSIESEVLLSYKERLPETAKVVSAGQAVLLDRSYRDYLALSKDSIVSLNIY